MIRSVASKIVVGADGDRRADDDAHRDAQAHPQLAALGVHPLAAPHPHRCHRDAGGRGEARDAGLARHELEVGRDLTLGEHAHALAVRSARAAESSEPSAPSRAVDGDLVGVLEEEPEDGGVPQLGHREEADLAVGALAQPQHDERVEERDVVARQQHRPLARDAARADAADVERGRIG